MYDPFMRGFNCVPVCGYFTTIFEKRRAAFDKDVDLKKTAVTVNADTIIPGRHHFNTVIHRKDHGHSFFQINLTIGNSRIRR